MSNLLLLAWTRLLGDPDRPKPRGRITAEAQELSADEAADPAGGLLLVLRRMRYPIITIVLIFSISVVGLVVIPGVDTQGRPIRLSLFDAFYVISYTATTIGFSETPYEFTIAQRMWMTAAIYLSVIGWAYGIGSLLALTRDQSFRRALARRHAARKIAHVVEPFHILVGYGSASKRIARALDDLGRRFVVLELSESRVSSIDLDGYRADTPALLGNARETRNLVVAGLTHPRCEGIIAMTGDDQTNLDVTMTAGLLRPGLPVIALTSSREMAERMRAFDAWHVVNPLDRFGDHLRILTRSPEAYRLMTWLTSAPGTRLPALRSPVPRGRWVVCGTGTFADEMIRDLHAEGVEVTVVRGGASGLVRKERSRSASERTPEPGDEVDELHAAGLETAAAFVAAGEDDTTNLWLLHAAREVNPRLFTVAFEQRASNVPLFDALDVSFGTTPAEVVGTEVMARLGNPALMSLLPAVPRMGQDWCASLVQRLVERCGSGTPDLWLVRLDTATAPALAPRLQRGELRLGDLMRNPVDRNDPLAAVVLALLRDGESVPTPGDDETLRTGDELLLAASRSARRALDATLAHEPTTAYVVEDRIVPSSWIWRAITGRGQRGRSQRHTE